MPSMIKRGNRMKCTKKDVEDIFTNVAKEYGFEDVQADVCQFKAFKMRYTTDRKWWVILGVSDYLIGMKSESVEDLARFISADLSKKEYEMKGFFANEVLSKDFLKRNQMKFLKRDRSLTSEGRDRIDKALEVLKSKGHIEDDDDRVITFRATDSFNPVMFSSVFKTIELANSMLDVDDDVLEYAIWSGIKSIEVGREAVKRNERTTNVYPVLEGYEDARSLIFERYKP